MKVLVTGAAGQLGTDVCSRLESLGHECVRADLPGLDITDGAAVSEFFLGAMPQAVIHCAAFTDVNRAEAERELCKKINVDGSRNVAAAAEKCGAKLIYISTDYVFGGNGQTPYEPDDAKSPVNAYGETKLMGENAVLEECSRVFIVRTSWVFGLHGGNFVKTMLRLCAEKESVTVVDDQIGSPTFTEDLAALLCSMVQSSKFGVYHATNEGCCSWAEFAAAIASAAGLPAKIIPVTSDEYVSAAKRPLNSRLSKACLDKAGFARLPSWQDALGRFLAESI